MRRAGTVASDGRGRRRSENSITTKETMTPRFSLICAAFAISAGAANAQLLIGFDDTTAGATDCWRIDVGTGVATPLFTAPYQAWGMAADDANGVIYVINGSTLYSVAYGTPPLAPATLGTLTDIGTGATLSFVSAAWANGELYATRNIANEAVYHIETDPLDPDYRKATVVLDYTDADYDFGGFDYNPVDGMFYATNDDTSPWGSGLFRLDVFGAGTITLVTPYPPLAGTNDCDGLAIGGNKAYFIEDQPSDIDVYDLTLGAFGTPLPNPMPTSEIFSSGCWAPSLFGCTGNVADICDPSAPDVTDGCTPDVDWTGTPDVTQCNTVGASDFVVTFNAMAENKNCNVVIGKGAPVSSPWSTESTRCFPTPYSRTGFQDTGGTGAGCTGSVSLDVENYLQGGNPLLTPVVAGDQFVVQAWYRDPNSSKTTQMTDAATFTVCP
jgi:hypothetical protein